MEITNTLLSFVTDSSEITECFRNVDLQFDSLIKSCYTACVKHEDSVDICHKFDIELLLDFLHDELNTSHWSEVSLDVRHAFQAASFLKAIVILKRCTVITVDILREVLKTIDLGLLLGAPLKSNCDLLNQCATLISKEIQAAESEESTAINTDSTNIKPKLSKRKYVVNNIFERLQAKNVAVLKCPSIETFNKLHFLPQVPAKLQDCISHWPARQKWLDVNYLLKVAGARTVPVEIGKHYADENWSQKLMTLQEFIRKYYLSDTDDIGYLAQHNLFEQIDELKQDIRIPEYCCLSRTAEESDDPDINAWFGPKGTVSPLHYDPKDNILTQVFGTKLVLMFSPVDSPYLYPHQDSLLFNTAQVDPLNPDFEKFPNFSKSKMYKCILEAGDMLYIPSKWWHHVIALSKSFSVSFWWK